MKCSVFSKYFLVMLAVSIFSVYSCMARSDEGDERTEKIGNSGCYDYLAELVKSSNFPFFKGTKSISKVLIDTDEDGKVSAQVFYETSGTGIMGWVEYDVDDQKLFNTSANLEVPKELKFNKKYSKQFDQCVERALK
ncbi:hypothetical protein [Pseudomonas fluorescens]|uniref:hypothetical protein n=1 Tax=Pseudomonas fluorescens TaxID=294 RepID=UPI003D1E1B7D